MENREYNRIITNTTNSKNTTITTNTTISPYVYNERVVFVAFVRGARG